MIWTINVSATALKDLKRIDKSVARRIIQFIKNRLVTHPDPASLAKRLKGKHSQFWRFRVGNYRLICDIQLDTYTILVLAIGHRKTVY